MSEANYYKMGSVNVICDRCGQKRKRETCKKEWTGLLTCNFCWDPKHPWNLPLPIAIDGLPVPDARPRPNSIYINPNGIERWGSVYQDISGNIYSNISWSAWNSYWGGNFDNVEFNSTNFPLV